MTEYEIGKKTKRRRAAVIGASAEALHGIETAKRLGIETIALDGDPLAAGLAAADRALTVDISDERAVLAALEQERPDFVLPVPIGRYLTTVGAVNDAFGLPGVSREAAVKCTDKYAFHQTLTAGGLRNCHCFLINREAPCGAGMYRECHFPAILKPRYGSGSRGIWFLKGEKQLAAALTEVLAQEEDYVLEEAVPGTEYGVDGVMEGASFHLVLLREKLLTPPPARQAVGYLSVVPQEREELYRSVQKCLAEVTKALDLRDCLFHADLMVQKEAGKENVFAIELSARPSGHNLHNLFTPLATGVDMAAEFLEYLCGGKGKFDPQQIRSVLIRYFDFEDCVIGRVPEAAEVREMLPEEVRLLEWRCALRPGEAMQRVTTGHSIMGRGLFILEAKPEVKPKLGPEVEPKLEVEVKPKPGPEVEVEPKLELEKEAGAPGGTESFKNAGTGSTADTNRMLVQAAEQVLGAFSVFL